MARVTLQNVAKSFGGDRGPWAVQDFSLDIADGELVVFVGPSGCGCCVITGAKNGATKTNFAASALTNNVSGVLFFNST